MHTMSKPTLITLKRDCDALLIPTAIPILLTAGTEVYITQHLGGAFTVHINGNLARIEGKDADALGLEIKPESSPTENALLSPEEVIAGAVDMDLVWRTLKTCYDPEIPVNIVDLGLIYHCVVTPLEPAGNRIDVQMTLTAPGCGMGPILAADVDTKLRSVPHVTEVQVQLVFDPPWNKDRMSDVAKLQLNLF